MIISEMELFYCFVACFAFAIEWLDTKDFLDNFRK